MTKIETITIDGYKVAPDVNSDTFFATGIKPNFEGLWDVWAPNGDFVAQTKTLESAKQIALDHIQADMMTADLRKQGR